MRGKLVDRGRNRRKSYLFHLFDHFALLTLLLHLHRFSKSLKAIGIWSKDEIRHYKRPHSSFDLDSNAFSIPRHSPEADPEGTTRSPLELYYLELTIARDSLGGLPRRHPEVACERNEKQSRAQRSRCATQAPMEYGRVL